MPSREPVAGRKKPPRNITPTVEGWEILVALAAKRRVSVSQLIDSLGREELARVARRERLNPPHQSK